MCPVRSRSIVGGIPFAAYPQSRFQPCPRCGASVESARTAAHKCDDERLIALTIELESAGFDAHFAAWLASPPGRFAVWLAEQRR
jgi:hypothetical protein